jgi:uncharacterized membrane protein
MPREPSVAAIVFILLVSFFGLFVFLVVIIILFFLHNRHRQGCGMSNLSVPSK